MKHADRQQSAHDALTYHMHFLQRTHIKNRIKYSPLVEKYSRPEYAYQMKEFNLIMTVETREQKQPKCKYEAPSWIYIIRLD
jgi:hypothetical protein